MCLQWLAFHFRRSLKGEKDCKEEFSEELFHGKLIKLRIQTISQPSGGTTRFEIVEHPDAVAIVALRYDSLDGSDVKPHVLLVKQERPAIQKQTWELPAGLVEQGESDTPVLAAARELRERQVILPITGTV